MILLLAFPKLYPRPVEVIVPEPSEPVHAAIVEAIAQEARVDGVPRGGWAAAALAEAVAAAADADE